jgi:hypothetical protein
MEIGKGLLKMQNEKDKMKMWDFWLRIWLD